MTNPVIVIKSLEKTVKKSYDVQIIRTFLDMISNDFHNLSSRETARISKLDNNFKQYSYRIE
jgi:hypothetical protein